MRQSLAAQLNKTITTLIIVVVAFTPLFFLPNLTEYFEMPKVFLLVSLSLILLCLWAASWVLEGKVLITRTPLDLPLLLILIVLLSSTYFSPIRSISLFGNIPNLHGSATSWVAYILIYFIAASNLKTLRQIKIVLYTLLACGSILSLISLLSYFGVFIVNAPFAKIANFNPTGSSFGVTSILVLLLPLVLLSLCASEGSQFLERFLPKPLSLILAGLFTATIVLIGNPATWAASLVSLSLVVYINGLRSLKSFFIPLALGAVLLFLGLLPSQNKFNNPLYARQQNFPREIQLALNTSWKVAISAFRDSPFLGSGPSSFLFDFTYYKPEQQNSSKYWKLSFENSFNEFFQVLATLGGLGFLSLIFLVGVVTTFAWTGIKSRTKSAQDQITTSLSISSLVGVILLALHVSTPTSLVVFLVILAMLMAVHRSVSDKVEEVTIGIKASKLYDSNLIVGDILPLILFVLITGFVLYAGLAKLFPFIQADYYHRLGLNAASTKGINTYNNLVKAKQKNPTADLYRVYLAQTDFALANQVAANKGPTEASPAGSLTDQDKENIQQLISQSIAEGRAAVTINPLNAHNWEILGSIYRQISGIAQNALSFALDSYGRAIQRDPLNPLLRLDVGGIYYSIKNYDLAIRFFTDSVNIKPDFANGYYNLSVALRDKGDLPGAITTAERVLQLLDTNDPDYKKAEEYLNDLRNTVATGSATTQTTPPAAEETAVLQKKSLPKVINLPTKSDIATPPAVKK